eukprot:5156597-Ditylum_brightwellii.AAC.1
MVVTYGMPLMLRNNLVFTWTPKHGNASWKKTINVFNLLLVGLYHPLLLLPSNMINMVALTMP